MLKCPYTLIINLLTCPVHEKENTNYERTALHYSLK